MIRMGQRQPRQCDQAPAANVSSGQGGRSNTKEVVTECVRAAERASQGISGDTLLLLQTCGIDVPNGVVTLSLHRQLNSEKVA
jgi:hypothetical protein